MTTRHLYNNTDQAHSVSFAGGSLPDLPGAEGGNGVIQPNSSCSLEFDQDQGGIEIDGGRLSYFFATDFSADPTWQHSGSTDDCVLNDPANGDFTITG